jgi:hypothetical protein
VRRTRIHPRAIAVSTYFWIGLQIQNNLKLVHTADVPKATINTWLKEVSPEFVKDQLKKRPDETFATIKTIPVDRSELNLGKDIIGKKGRRIVLGIKTQRQTLLIAVSTN